MTGTAAYSHKPWQADVPFDSFEDFLHSLTATGIGLSFAIGVMSILIARSRAEARARVYDALAVVAATALPLLMVNLTDMAGGLQRLMFAIAFIWFAAGALRVVGRGRTDTGG